MNEIYYKRTARLDKTFTACRDIEQAIKYAWDQLQRINRDNDSQFVYDDAALFMNVVYDEDEFTYYDFFISTDGDDQGSFMTPLLDRQLSFKEFAEKCRDAYDYYDFVDAIIGWNPHSIYICKICGEEFDNDRDAEECCREEK